LPSGLVSQSYHIVSGLVSAAIQNQGIQYRSCSTAAMNEHQWVRLDRLATWCQPFNVDLAQKGVVTVAVFHILSACVENLSRMRVVERLHALDCNCELLPLLA
jgi:hypothetical protein